MMDYDKLLNDEQILPVKDTEGQLLVLAGAGSGKTRVLTYRIAYLLEEKGVHPYNILAITFTNKAAGEMKERLVSLVGTSEMWISTFHSFCNRILRFDIDRLGYGKNYSIYTEGDSEKLIQRIMKEMEIDDGELKKTVKNHISSAKNFALSPDKYYAQCTHPKADKIFKIYSRYEEELRRANALDFDDLILKTIELFAKFPEVLRKYQERFKYVHIDEFQDTNKIQYLLVRLISAYHKNLFVVGDDDQSIYGWRGAEVGNILNFKKDFPEAKIYKLQRNYRSSGNILKCANSIIANNNMRMGKKLVPNEGDGVKVVYKSNFDDRQEADYVLKEIIGLIDNNGYKPSDFAILVRINSITRTFEERMNMYGIPYKIYGGFKFYERKEVKDTVAYLRMLANPKDTESILRIINVPKRGIGDVVQKRLCEYAYDRDMALLDVIKEIWDTDLPVATKKKVDVFRELVVCLEKALKEMTLGKFIEYMLEKIEFESEYDANIQEEYTKLENIKELATSIKQFCRDNGENTTLDEYLESLALISDTDDINEGNYLTLATIHGVKGLEFRCVFVVGLEEGIFPSTRAIESADIEEERRIMYVAVTRAKERLYLTNASQRYRYGKMDSNVSSRFISESGVEGDMTKYKAITSAFSNNTDKAKNNYTISSEYRDRIKDNLVKPTPSSKDISVFKVGQKIRHNRFGEGRIISIRGENAEINFDKLGTKMFNLRLAPITVIE